MIQPETARCLHLNNTLFILPRGMEHPLAPKSNCSRCTCANGIPCCSLFPRRADGRIVLPDPRHHHREKDHTPMLVLSRMYSFNIHIHPCRFAIFLFMVRLPEGLKPIVIPKLVPIALRPCQATNDHSCQIQKGTSNQ